MLRERQDNISMRLLFLGSGEFGVPLLRNLAQQHDIAMVISQPDRPSGRGRQTRPTPIKAMAEKLGLEVMTPRDVNDPEVTARLLELGATVGVVVAFGQKVGPGLLDGLPGGCINAHASLLPRHRGAAPIHYAIRSGDEETGVTVFRLTDRMDAGAILAMRRTAIDPDETTTELHDRLAGIAVDAMSGALERLAADPTTPGTVQDEAAATLAPKLRKEDGRIPFAQPVDRVAAHICAMWSWPGASTTFVSQDGARREELIIARARPAEGQPVDLPPGTIDERMYVATGDGLLEILEVKAAGGRLMTWPEYVNGRHIAAGDRFE